MGGKAHCQWGGRLAASGGEGSLRDLQAEQPGLTLLTLIVQCGPQELQTFHCVGWFVDGHVYTAQYMMSGSQGAPASTLSAVTRMSIFHRGTPQTDLLLRTCMHACALRLCTRACLQEDHGGGCRLRWHLWQDGLEHHDGASSRWPALNAHTVIFVCFEEVS